MKKLFLVTGANGHLGYNVCLLLKEDGYDVRTLVLESDNPERLNSLGVEVFFGDVTNPTTLEDFFTVPNRETTYLIHCAGIVSITNKNLDLLYKVNFEGTQNITKLFKDKQLFKMVYVSSVHAIKEEAEGQTIAEPDQFDEKFIVGEYAKSKAKTSNYIKQQAFSGLNICLVHPSGIFGPGDAGQGHLTMMIEDYLNGQLTSRVKGAYDFVDVRDVARGTIQAALVGHRGESYILSGHRIDLNQFFETLRKLSGKKGIINVLPTWFAKLSIPFATLYYKLRKKPPIYSKYSLYTLQTNAVFSTAKAEAELGYKKTPFEQSIKATIKWLNDEGRIKSEKVKKYIKNNY
ncbi:MAG: NAD-dependent epimerase/dehydratase family protein [Acholeplasma sp.]|nr:NAD-dependent epimerase/dehydratase family protein [Acholeplasma sp.]